MISADVCACFFGPLVLCGMYDLILRTPFLGFRNYIILLHVFDVSFVYRCTL